MSRKVSVGVLLGCAAVLAAVVAGYAGSARSATSGAQALPSSSCGPVIYKGSGSPDFIIPSDLPLQGAIRAQVFLPGDFETNVNAQQPANEQRADRAQSRACRD